jgi:hypothetical protein
VYDGGIKPDGSGQRLSTEKFETILPDGTLATSFCADLGAHNVWGKYLFDANNHGFSDYDMLHLVAALDYINEEFSLNKNLEDHGFDAITGKALAQIIVWKMILKVDGNGGYAETWPTWPDVNTKTAITEIEGTSDWYTSDYKALVDDILSDGQKYIDIYKNRTRTTTPYVTGVVFIVGDGSLQPINQQRQIFVLFGNGTVFDNKTNILGNAYFNKVLLGGKNRKEHKWDNAYQFSFDLFKKAADKSWEFIETYTTDANGTVSMTDLFPGKYKVVEKAHDVWKIEDSFEDGIFFKIDKYGNTKWKHTGTGGVPVIVNVPVLGPSYGTVTGTNEGKRLTILAGLDKKTGNAIYNKKENSGTPFVIPNSNHFVFAIIDRNELEKGVSLDMMVGNTYDVIGKAFVKLEGGNIEIAMNGVGTFGAIAFGSNDNPITNYYNNDVVPIFNNGNIHSQKEADLKAQGAVTGFNHDNKTSIPCPAGNTIILYIHCNPMQFYKDIIAW